MICPACKSDMIVIEHKKIELDYCTQCQGVWFDSGELELFLESARLQSSSLFLNNLAATAEFKSVEEKRKCPICNRKLKKRTMGEHPAILVDVCQRGDGLWFDGGELGQLIKQLVMEPSPQPKPEHEVTAFLKEVFRAGGVSQEKQTE